MPSKGIMRSGLSGKKLMKRTSRRRFTRRTSPGAMEGGGDGAALDDETEGGPPLLAKPLQPPEDEELIGGFGAAVLVERIVAPVREGANLMAHGHEFVAKIHAHVVGTVEGQHD